MAGARPCQPPEPRKASPRFTRSPVLGAAAVEADAVDAAGVEADGVGADGVEAGGVEAGGVEADGVVTTDGLGAWVGAEPSGLSGCRILGGVPETGGGTTRPSLLVTAVGSLEVGVLAGWVELTRRGTVVVGRGAAGLAAGRSTAAGVEATTAASATGAASVAGVDVDCSIAGSRLGGSGSSVVGETAVTVLVALDSRWAGMVVGLGRTASDDVEGVSAADTTNVESQ